MPSVGREEEKKANAEWRFLARRALMLCQTIDQASGKVAHGGPGGREASLQGEAFRERRERALYLMGKIRDGRDSPAHRLEDFRRIVSGLECSQSFFISRRKTA